VAQPIGPRSPSAWYLTTATMLAMSWTHLRGQLIQARPNRRKATAPLRRRLLTKLSAMELPSPSSSDHDPGDQIE
jgi:hypothetical protein